MLSIGKLGRGAEGYYLKTVAKGLEDYYLGSGEALGRWIGRGSARLGLSGVVDGNGVGLGPAFHIDRYVMHSPQKPADPRFVKRSFGGEKADAPSVPLPGRPLDEGEFQVAKMCHRQHSSAGVGEMFETGLDSAQPPVTE